MQLYYFYLRPTTNRLNREYLVLAESEEIARQEVVKSTKIQNIADFLCEIYPAHTVVVI